MFKNDIEDGPMEAFYENGNFKEKGNFKDGKKYGNWEYYDEEGKLTEKADL